VLDVSAARDAWPGVELGEDELRSMLDARGIDAATACLPDLYLACAITRGNGAAVRAFESVLARDVPPAIAYLDGGTALVVDVQHAVRERLLGNGATPGKITEYSGRGELRGWLRVVAVREALQLLRQRKREAPLPDDHDLAAHIGPVQPVALDDRARAIHRDAFRTALASLTARDRNLMRQHYLHGATIDELGALHGVHRATTARWLAELRDTLLVRTRQHVAAALRLDGAELDSEMQRVASHLDVSLCETLSIER
jgi:RNA polymerase sigma-70 factor (ECF subfamily)